MAIKIIQNVPADQVAKYERLFRDAGATDVDLRPETDGEFTMIVTYPDRERFSQLEARLGS